MRGQIFKNNACTFRIGRCCGNRHGTHRRPRIAVDVAINGWSDVAHIDIELNEYISVCFYVESPSQDISDFIK